MAAEDDSPFSEDAEEDRPRMASAVDRDRQERARRLAKRQRAQQLGLWRTLLSTKTGRRDIYAILGGDRLFAWNFVNGPDGSPNSAATWFEWGKKAYGQDLLHQLMVIDGPGVLKMMRENDPAFVEPAARPAADDSQEPWEER